MSTSKIITDYSKLADDKLDSTASAGIKGKTDAGFIFNNGELTSATSAQSKYHNALADVPTGNDVTVTNKNTARAALVKALSTLCIQINILSGGDLATLQGTGFPLAKEGEHHEMPVPANFKIAYGTTAGSFVLSVDKPANITNHGTVFSFWNPIYTPMPASPDDWFHRSCNGHSMTITGLVPGTNYPFASAYKGSDSDPLVWSAVVTKMAGN